MPAASGSSRRIRVMEGVGTEAPSFFSYAAVPVNEKPQRMQVVSRSNAGKGEESQGGGAASRATPEVRCRHGSNEDLVGISACGGRGGPGESGLVVVPGRLLNERIPPCCLCSV